MKQKLVFLDIDGTLTPPGSNTPPASAIDAVRRAQAKGHLVFLCTGRNPAMLSPVYRLGFDGAVASAGGYVFVGDRVLFDCPMPQEEFETGMRLLRERGVLRTIEARDATWWDEDVSDFLGQAGEGNSEMMRWREVIGKQLNIRPISEYDGRPIYKIVFMCRNAQQLEPAREALEAQYHFVVQELTEHNCVNGELINRRFDKGRGVRMIADALGVPIEDSIGFGDSMNDVEMIETVGVSVCMENGSQALKEKSSLICPAVDQDGLAWAFEKLGLI